MYTSTQLSSASINSALILDSSNTMAIMNVNDASGNLAICQFTFSNQQMNWIKVTGTSVTPEWIGIVSSTNDLFYTAITQINYFIKKNNTEKIKFWMNKMDLQFLVNILSFDLFMMTFF